MEKAIRLLWQTDQVATEYERHQLLANSKRFKRSGAYRVRLNVIDADVSPAQTVQITQIDNSVSAMIRCWLDSARQHKTINTHTPPLNWQIVSYLVTEPEPLKLEPPIRAGQRVSGMVQIAFLDLPVGLTRKPWLDIGCDAHGSLAIDIKTPSGYWQNSVQRKPIDNTPVIKVIVEDTLLALATTDPAVFYGCPGDTEGQQAMIESVIRFIERDNTECPAISEYQH